ncbi:MAG: putative O-linked N-acetylglucosamine transferase, family [Planctomycetaceae bacterium]|nr:putative O-linked N-acetylglucosamine transferase, family [Planctomycetaceae bacterium]
MSETPATDAPAPVPAQRPKYVPAVGPRLKRLLMVVFVMLALLGANSGYLAAITGLEWITGQTYQDSFYLWMVLAHVALGILILGPFLAFGFIHMFTSWNRKNKRAIRVGYALFAACLVVLISGLFLIRIVGVFDLKQPVARSTIYWLHVAVPLMAGWLYWLHRLVGPKIKWRVGGAYLGLVGASLLIMIGLKTQDPRQWNVAGPKDGADKYFFPSLARTSTGNFIPAKTLQMDDYCQKCHQDAHADWSKSAHRFSSFNNPAYLASVRETRKASIDRLGTVQASRWCAGCHDPVPFLSGAFDDPKFDDVEHVTAHAGITCTSCHAITHINSARGNGDYTMEEPLHYPFAYSENAILQYINNQLVKAKPAFHKKTFLKPLHKSTEFCSTCHKVHLPPELNNYKWLRGQNHYDAFLLSGVSGHGARSFYYPPKAQENCNSCHMPAKESNDFGAKAYLAGSNKLNIHDHLFPSANTGIAYLKENEDVIQRHQEFLQGIMRVDVFGLREGGTIDGKLVAPLRPQLPTLKPGSKYLLETVIRTTKMGHVFTQGTADSNEIWLDVTVKSGDRIIGRNGAMDEDRGVDPRSHFVNLFMLDRKGNRIDRRNPQDIFVPLYNNQIPPGAAATVHYHLELPGDLKEAVTIEIKLQYRKFDKTYMDFVTKSAKPGDRPIRDYTPGQPYKNTLPITTMAVDSVTLPVEGMATQPANPDVKTPAWERWNDYGIGMIAKANPQHAKAQLRQAKEAFEHVEELKRFDGPLNLTRVHFIEGTLNDAVASMERAAKHTDPAPYPWVMAWMSGQINRQQGHLAEAEKNFRSVLEDDTPERRSRGFDFSMDYEVRNLLGQTLFERAQQIRGAGRADEKKAMVQDSIAQFQKTLKLDSENLTAHYNLHLLYELLGDKELAKYHDDLHRKYKPDDNAGDKALAAARKQYPAADAAAEALVIYPLHHQKPPQPQAANGADEKRLNP